MLGLSKSDRKALKDRASVVRAKVVESRGTDRLIEAQVVGASDKVRGWWHDGESAADIKFRFV